MQINFNINILNTLFYKYPDKAMLIKNRFPQFDYWLKAEEKPTFNQLLRISNYFKIPFGYLFLNALPQKQYPIPHYRTLSNQPFQPSPELFDIAETILERQQWTRDILIEQREGKLPFANSTNLQIPVETAVSRVRDVLKLPVDWAHTVPSWTEALRLLIDQAEVAGIFVAMNGVVNNNTKRKLDIDEFRGFVLHDDYAPFVFINNNDAISGKIFTLVHEIAHILLGKSASFDLRKLQPADDATEKYCDRIAAEFLVPENALRQQVKEMGVDYGQLARVFKVSRIVIARRLQAINVISRERYFEFYDEYIGKENGNERNQNSKKGGNFYNTVPYRVGRRFFAIIYSEVRQNKLLYRDAFKLTGLKPKTFDEYVRKHLK